MKNKNWKIESVILIMMGLVLAGFSFAQEENVKIPENFQEAKGLLEKVFEILKDKLPQAISKIWKEEVVPVWQKIYEWLKVYWLKFKNWFQNIFQSKAKEEIVKRKPVIEEEFEKEKEELKAELPKIRENLWQRFLDLITSSPS